MKDYKAAENPSCHLDPVPVEKAAAKQDILGGGQRRRHFEAVHACQRQRQLAQQRSSAVQFLGVAAERK
jgi:hypothetical protein